MPLVVANGKVSSKYDEENPQCPKVRVFAWGSGGSKKATLQS
jgi:hypothetical protein